jgi:hypothetical protein
LIRGRRWAFLLLILALILALTGPVAAATWINLSEPGQSRLFDQENSALYEENSSYNVTLLHHVYYYPELEIPPWLWAFFLVGGILLVLFSLMWAGALQISWLTSVLSLLFLFVAEFTSFAIRDVIFSSGMALSPTYGSDQLISGYFVISTVQPTVIAWDWVIPFFFTMGVLVVAILNFIVITLEMAGPGLKYFRSNIFRRG